MKKLWVLLLAACAHVELVLPPAEASHDERVHAYERLKPVNAERYRLIEARKVEWTRALVLANGFEVQDPVDLKPAVLPGSKTALAIAEYEHKTKPWSVLAPIAGFGFAAGATTLLASIIFGTTQRRSFDPAVSPVGWVALTGIAVMAVLPIVALVTGFIIAPDAEQERAVAFSSYGGDLREKLRIDEGVPEAAPPPSEEPAPQP